MLRLSVHRQSYHAGLFSARKTSASNFAAGVTCNFHRSIACSQIYSSVVF